jgi:hypothetical protein
MAARSSQNNALGVGARVKLDLGGREVSGTVIEDRGFLGVGGRRLLRVRLDWSGVAEPIEVEVPESDLRRAA